MTSGYALAQGTVPIKEKEKVGISGTKPHGPTRVENKPSLMVDGNNQYAQFTMDAEGGIKTFSISTNQGTPTVSNLPSWLSIVNISTSSLQVKCAPNMTPNQREADFRINAGDNSVRVHVRQPTGRITIKKCEFLNTDDYSETISGPSSRFSASEVRYLNPILTYDGPGKTQEKTILVKIYNPRGKLIVAAKAPEGYSYKDKVSFFPGKDQTITLMGFGRPNNNIYGTGIVRAEVYMDDVLVASGTVEIY